MSMYTINLTEEEVVSLFYAFVDTDNESRESDSTLNALEHYVNKNGGDAALEKHFASVYNIISEIFKSEIKPIFEKRTFYHAIYSVGSEIRLTSLYESKNDLYAFMSSISSSTDLPTKIIEIFEKEI